MTISMVQAQPKGEVTNVELTKSMKFIVSFLVLVLLLSMFTNGKLTYQFLVLVLLSMFLLNTDIFKKLTGGLQYHE
jgi:hypothetical protein